MNNSNQKASQDMDNLDQKTRKESWEAESRAREEAQASEPSTSQSRAREEAQASEPSTSQSNDPEAAFQQRLSRARYDLQVKKDNKTAEEELNKKRIEQNFQSALGLKKLDAAKKQAKKAEATLIALENEAAQKQIQQDQEKIKQDREAFKQDQEAFKQNQEAFKQDQEKVKQEQEKIKQDQEKIKQDQAGQDEALLRAEERTANREEFDMADHLSNSPAVLSPLQESEGSKKKLYLYYELVEESEETQNSEESEETQNSEESEETQNYELGEESEETENYELVAERGETQNYELVDPTPTVPAPAGFESSLFGRGVIFSFVVSVIGGSIGFHLTKWVSKVKETAITTKENDIPGEEKEEK